MFEFSVLSSAIHWLSFSRQLDGLSVFLEKNRTSSNSFGQSKCQMYYFRSNKPRLGRVCICGMCMCVCVDVSFHGCMIRNSAQTSILSGSLSNLQHSHRMYMFRHVYTHICVCLPIRICSYTHLCLYTYEYTGVHIYTCIEVCVHIYSLLYMYVTIHVYKYTQTNRTCSCCGTSQRLGVGPSDWVARFLQTRLSKHPNYGWLCRWRWIFCTAYCDTWLWPPSQ